MVIHSRTHTYTLVYTRTNLHTHSRPHRTEIAVYIFFLFESVACYTLACLFVADPDPDCPILLTVLGPVFRDASFFRCYFFFCCFYIFFGTFFWYLFFCIFTSNFFLHFYILYIFFGYLLYYYIIIILNEF